MRCLATRVESHRARLRREGCPGGAAGLKRLSKDSWRVWRLVALDCQRTISGLLRQISRELAARVAEKVYVGVSGTREARPTDHVCTRRKRTSRLWET
jgi:hypothetical protein